MELAFRRTDLLLPAAVAAVGTAEIVLQAYRPLGVALATFWLAALVLCARRVFPLAMPLVVSGIYALTPLVGFDVSEPAVWIVVLVLACLAAGLHVPRSRAAFGLGSVVGSCAIVVAALAAFTDFKPDIMFGVFMTIGPWVLGVASREALERNGELAAEAERMRLEHAQAIERAAAGERKRIARELHDVLAHSLSVMVVQASLAEDMISRDPSSATAAIREVQQSGRDALGETGRLLRLIRDDGDELGMQPQHVVADLPALTDEYARAGLDVELELDPRAGSVQAGVGLSAYRIVQEALTNVLKHAPGSRVTVRLARRGKELSIEVRNGPAAAEAPAAVSGGHGLVGIRERISLFGGTLSAAPTGDGGFRLAATLPTPPEKSLTSVVLVDDQELVRSGLRLMLEARGITVLAEAENGREAIEAARAHRPDVLVMDIRMPVLDGIAATRELALSGLSTRVLILTTYDLDQYVYEALKAGAAGFMLKASPPDRLAAAIEVVAAGESLLAPQLTQRLIAEYIDRPAPAAGVPDALLALTEREREVLTLIARGLSNEEIAATLVVSGATVKTHVNRILSKLDLRTRVQAVVLAYESGLVRPGRG